jgi:hypothetical protein
MRNTAGRVLLPALFGIVIFGFVATAILLDTPDEATIAIFDALGGWAAAAGALIAARFAWKIWNEQRAENDRERLAEAEQIEFYLSGDVVIWFGALKRVRAMATNQKPRMEGAAYADIVNVLDRIDLKPFHDMLPRLWRTPIHFGNAISVAMSTTQRLQTYARRPLGQVRPSIELATRCDTIVAMAESAMASLELPYGRVQRRWGDPQLVYGAVDPDKSIGAHGVKVTKD